MPATRHGSRISALGGDGRTRHYPQQGWQLLRIARFRGPDLDSATQAELMATSARLNSALKRLGTGWAIYVEAQRSRRPAIRCRTGSPIQCRR